MRSSVPKPFTFLNSIFHTLPALVLVTAALTKANDPFVFLEELANYEFPLPIDLEAALGLLLPGIEAFLGLWLLFNRSRAAILSCCAIFIVFTVGIIIGIPEGYLQKCGCLGAEDLSPGFAIGKNVILLGFLAWSLRVKLVPGTAGNPWGALALITGGVFSVNSGFFILLGIGLVLASRDKVKHAAAFLIGFAIGLYFNWMYFPVVALPLLGALFYLLKFEVSKRSIYPALILGGGVLICTYFSFFPLDTDGKGIHHYGTGERGIEGKVPNDGLVIWITGGLKGNWKPVKAEGYGEQGGVLRIARALELYRQEGELLVDLGNFRYPENADPGTDTVKILSDGYLKALARLNYTAINVTDRDIGHDPAGLALAGEQYGLPLIRSGTQESKLFRSTLEVQISENCPIQIYTSDITVKSEINRNENAIRILLLTSTAVDSLNDALNEFDLILWLNEGEPLVQINGRSLVLGMGNHGFLGRIEIRCSPPSEREIDLSGWLNRPWSLHHPARERMRVNWRFWKKKPAISACLWAVPKELSPHQKTLTQMEQIRKKVEDTAITN